MAVLANTEDNEHVLIRSCVWMRVCDFHSTNVNICQRDDGCEDVSECLIPSFLIIRHIVCIATYAIMHCGIYPVKRHCNRNTVAIMYYT